MTHLVFYASTPGLFKLGDLRKLLITAREFPDDAEVGLRGDSADRDLAGPGSDVIAISMGWEAPK